MMKSRATFELALRQNEFKIQSRAKATKLADRDTRGFGKRSDRRKLESPSFPTLWIKFKVNVKLLKCDSISSDIDSTVLKIQNQIFA